MESKPILITSEHCPNCKKAKEYLWENNVKFDIRGARDVMDLVNKFKIDHVPALIVGEKAYFGLIGIIRYVNLDM